MKEIIERRSRNGKVFDLGGGKFRAELGNHSHCLKNGVWVPTDETVDIADGTAAGFNYFAKSRANVSDYDIRFGKNDPLWMKITSIPLGKSVTLKPKGSKNKPNCVVVGNKITVTQAWDGIDVELFLTKNGVKSNFIITSTAGQRTIEFDVNGDFSSFNFGAPFVKTSHPVPVIVPHVFSKDVLSYDFRNLPVGTVVDPTVTSNIGKANMSITSTSNTTYYNIGYLFSYGTTYYPHFWYDFSSISGPVTVSSAVLSVWNNDCSANASTHGLYRIIRANDPQYSNWTYSGVENWGSAGANGPNDIDTTAIATIAYDTTSATLRYDNFSDCSAAVEDIINDGATNQGFMIRMITVGSAIWRQWRDATVSGKEPYFTITYEAASGGSNAIRPSFRFGGALGLFGPRVY